MEHAKHTGRLYLNDHRDCHFYADRAENSDVKHVL